jgi:hypothetical protein
MYDPSGADTGREWIEVTNTGENSVDMGKFKLFENETNHKLKIVSGSAVLAPHASAILADNTEKFLVDYPDFSGVLFDTTFSLSNTGETLVLKDASSTPVDTVSYVAAEDANGTGGSLQKNGGKFVAALATPGVYPGALTPVPQKKASVATKTKKASSPAPASTLAASPAGFVPALPSNALWLLGLAGVILLGIAGVVFLSIRPQETSVTADEFKIE